MKYLIAFTLFFYFLGIIFSVEPVFAAGCGPDNPELCKSRQYVNPNLTPPSGWLKGFSVPNLPTGGLDFIGATVVPNLINVLLFVIFIASLIMLIVGGITWIMSRGEKEAMAKAKGTVTYALVGLVLALSSWLILNIIGTIFGIKF